MFGCCTFAASEPVCVQKKKIKTMGLPRYQVIVDNEVQVEARRSSSFSGPSSEQVKKINQIQRWKYEGGRFISRVSSELQCNPIKSVRSNVNLIETF